jgi:hypothetical protein
VKVIRKICGATGSEDEMLRILWQGRAPSELADLTFESRYARLAFGDDAGLSFFVV